VSGTLAIVGIGPGADEWITPEARALVDDATDLIGYGPYIDRLPVRPNQKRHASDNRVELDRARHAIALAKSGARVAVISGGDPGIFAMAAAVFEAMDKDGVDDLDVRVAPGISAVQAAAARLGAPIGHDFCVISLSDNLKPWDIVARRLVAAAEADFVIALYNPASKARPKQIFDAFELLRANKDGGVTIVFARAIGRPDERIIITTLAEADPSVVDMSTLVLIGSSETRLVARKDARPWVYTPRSMGGVA
jgi:precorrin-3B C17-methyltransferase